MLAEHTTVLNKDVHARLLQDIESICATAGVPRASLFRSAKEVCNATEIDWLTNFKHYRYTGQGLLLSGHVQADSKLMAVVSALLRNFIDARLVSVNSLIDDKPPDCTVLAIPNLYVKGLGKSLPAWKIQGLYDLLLSRLTANKPTVVYVESLEGVEAEYGPVFADHLRQHYRHSK